VLRLAQVQLVLPGVLRPVELAVVDGNLAIDVKSNVATMVDVRLVGMRDIHDAAVMRVRTTANSHITRPCLLIIDARRHQRRSVLRN